MSLSLTYSTYSVTLRGPEIGDTKRYYSGALTRTTKGLYPQIFKNDDWPVLEYYQYSFRSLTKEQVDDFLELYEAAVGKSVTLEESYGVTLTGYIVNQAIEQLTIKDDCSYDLEFEFLATIVSFPVGDCLNDPNYDTITPEVGDSNFHSTVENDTYYQLHGEDSEQLEGEDSELLYGENF